MPEYGVWVEFEGQGRVKVRANSEAEAEEDAKQMDLADIEESMFDIRVIRARQIKEESITNAHH